jgi:hypothetical protein
VSGCRTGITIAVYAINRETGERREIKPSKHYDGEKLTTWSASRHVLEPCHCRECNPEEEQVKLSSVAFCVGRKEVICPGNHCLEDDDESPGMFICEPCGITLVIHTYAAYERTGTVCGNCGAEVIEGPKGGYVCGNCYYVVKPKE